MILLLRLTLHLCISQETDEEERFVNLERRKVIFSSRFRLVKRRTAYEMKNGERKSVYRYMPLSLSGCGFDIDEGPRNEVSLSVASGIYRAQYVPCAH